MKYRARIKPREIIVEDCTPKGYTAGGRWYDPDELEILGEVDEPRELTKEEIEYGYKVAERLKDIPKADWDRIKRMTDEKSWTTDDDREMARAILEVQENHLKDFRNLRDSWREQELHISDIEAKVEHHDSLISDTPDLVSKTAILETRISDIEGEIKDLWAGESSRENVLEDHAKDIKNLLEARGRIGIRLANLEKLSGDVRFSEYVDAKHIEEHGTEPPTDEEIEQEFLENYKPVAKSFHEHPAWEIAPCPNCGRQPRIISSLVQCRKCSLSAPNRLWNQLILRRDTNSLPRREKDES